MSVSVGSGRMFIMPVNQHSDSHTEHIDERGADSEYHDCGTSWQYSHCFPFFAITAESLCYMPGYGIGDAATTLVGQTHGAGRVGLCKNFAYMTVGLGMAVMAVMGVVMYVFAPEMIGVLSPVESIREMGTICLRIEAFAEPFFAASIVTYCVCVGAGDTRKPAMINLGTMWLVRLTLAYALSKSYGLEGVWIAMAIELTFRGILFLIRLFRGSWMKSFHVG